MPKEFEHWCALSQRVARLEGVIRGLSRGSCWCEVAIGNPNYRGHHDPQCLQAAAAMTEAEKPGVFPDQIPLDHARRLVVHAVKHPMNVKDCIECAAVTAFLEGLEPAW